MVFRRSCVREERTRVNAEKSSPLPNSPRSGFAQFYSATLLPLRRYLARVLGNRADAQEIAHDAYARVYEAIDRQEVLRPQAFLFTVAHRLAISKLRRRRATPERETHGMVIELTPSDAPGVERLVMARQEWARLERAIADLPAGCRAVLRLCNEEDFSHAEIGAKLGISVSTVEKQHARALRLLRLALHDDAAPSAKNEPEGRTAANGK